MLVIVLFFIYIVAILVFNFVFYTVDFVLGFSFFFVLYFVMNIGWNTVNELWVEEYKAYNKYISSVSLAYYNLGLIEALLVYKFDKHYLYLVYWFINMTLGLKNNNFVADIAYSLTRLNNYILIKTLKESKKNMGKLKIKGVKIMSLRNSLMIYLSKLI